MLTRSRAKRLSSEEQGGQAINAVPEHSTVSRNDAMEFEEVQTVDHAGSSAGVSDGGERLHFRYLAWLLREKLNALVEGDQRGPSELELRSLLNVAVSRKIISVDPEMLNPFVWRTLPKDLLPLVFARLPVPDITRLRSLSKEWNRALATVNSAINRACDKASPRMVAGFTRRGDIPWETQELIVTICTQRSQYSYFLHLENPAVGEDGWDDMGAFDGGLVSFVSTWRPRKSKPLCIVVVNLLTGVRRKLPPLEYAYSPSPQMMHIEVDSETKCYKVVVIGHQRVGDPTVEIYDSGAGQWTKANPPLGLIFGLAHIWQWNSSIATFTSGGRVDSVYDFATRQLRSVSSLMSPFDGKGVISDVVQRGSRFVLGCGDPSTGETVAAEGHRITKYRVETSTGEWVHERSYSCSPIEDFLARERYRATLRPCGDFLLLFSESDSLCKHFWLLELSTGEWSSRYNCFQGPQYHGVFMSRAIWNVVP